MFRLRELAIIRLCLSESYMKGYIYTRIILLFTFLIYTVCWRLLYVAETCSCHHNRYYKVVHRRVIFLSLCILLQSVYFYFTQISEQWRMFSAVSTSVFSFPTHKELKEINVGNFSSLVFAGYWRCIAEAKRQWRHAFRSSPLALFPHRCSWNRSLNAAVAQPINCHFGLILRLN